MNEQLKSKFSRKKSWVAVGAVAVALIMVAGVFAAARGPTAVARTDAGLTVDNNGPACSSHAGTFFQFYDAESFTLYPQWQCHFVVQANTYGHGASPKVIALWNFHHVLALTTVCIADQGWAGDWFDLWASTSGAAGSYYLYGHTAPVATASEAVDTGYNALWTGAGTTFSSACFDFFMIPGQLVYLGIVDMFMIQLAQDPNCFYESALAIFTSGCTGGTATIASGWSPNPTFVSIHTIAV